jgi:E3 ubiquitin-protein ligase SHPRH
MGLGKTVEVIACILANPCPLETEIALEKFHLEATIEGKGDGGCSGAASRILPVSDLMTTNRFGVCICGTDRPFKGSLSFVVCRSCKEPLHGACAGFASNEEIIAETVPDFSELSDSTQTIVRLCSHDRCPMCYSTKITDGPLKSRATLIVTPSAILDQWEREIQRHATMNIRMDSPIADGVPITGMQNNVPPKVIVYPGIRNVFRHSSGAPTNLSGQRECRLVHPRFLADADVVLTTFDALMGDLGHSSENPYIADESLRLRGKKRYRVVPSPLARIKWWRVCLDEAQRVEVPTATSARMALQLEAEHRWCVSGTPIGRGKLEDLHGLFVFLRLEPFASKSWFRACLQPGQRDTMSRVQQLLKDILWRSTKSNEGVRIQMGIPAQVEKKIVLRFSSIEKHFYERQLEQTMLAASDLIGKKMTSKRRFQEGDLVSQHLHRLRAACCHPQVGSTGLGWSAKRRKANSIRDGDNENSIGSGVLTMSQILDKLIDDAKQQCEESQRLAVMHTNAMAALWRLKVSARQHGLIYGDSDWALLKRSCDLYMEALNLTERNAMPSTVIGEAMLTGCQGFLTPRKLVRDGVCNVQWKISSEDVALNELWLRYDFEGPSKIICQLTIESINDVPAEFKDKGYRLLLPKDCAFQVAHTSLGGGFVDVVSFSLDKRRCGQVTTLGGFRTNRSKAWRIVVRNFHDHDLSPSDGVIEYFVGLAIELFEPYIASDSIQRLHVLHNAAISMLSLQQARSADNNEVAKSPDDSLTTCRIEEMQNECRKIESLYLDGARAIHAEIKREFQGATSLRTNAFTDLSNACVKGTRRKISEMWHDTWWEDALSNCFLNGTPIDREQLCTRVQNDLDNFWQSQIGKDYRAKNTTMSLPGFQDVDGLQTTLALRVSNQMFENGDTSHSRCMNKFSELSAFPSQVEQMENSHCHKCHVDWSQTGPECNHCKLETELLRNEPDAMILGILGSIWKWLKDSKHRGKMGGARAAAVIDERAERFFDVAKASEKEWQRAKKLWRVHLDLLNDIDEVNQCKQSMRLARDGEDLTALTNDELNSIVFAVDIPSRLSDHSAKQAMALGTLRRHTQTLRFLRNVKIRESDDGKLIGAPNCIVCLSAMEGERAVLICGHSFHQECIRPLVSAKHNRAVIACPLRCTTKTTKGEIMIASDRCQDDGVQATRQIKGSWGTKVTRLLCDLLDVSELGEKSIVFSQWEDMLWVVEQALIANTVDYVRVKSMKQIGEVTKRFRSKDCKVLLLNVKNGAEGLTLVEATHIFMVEPLLNCGLDSQAISRIHRIGQHRTTYIHRYLIEDTIEIKIDKLRVDRQAEDQLEDSITDARRKHDIAGGGIDGGFSQGELHELLKA